MTAPAGARRALLTGATGFIGARLAAALRADGWSVDAIVRPTSARERVASLESAGCALHVHDGTLDSLRTAVRAAQPDCTWHLATRFIAEHAAADVVPLVRDNVEFGALLLEALTQLSAPRLVTAGSAWQQYRNAAYSPVSLYAAAKQAFDDLAAFYAEARGFAVVTCLMTDTYGPGDPRRKLVWVLDNAARTGATVPMTGDGRQLIDLMHVDDAVRALCVAGGRALAGAPGLRERWAVRPGRAIPVRELVDRFARARNAKVAVEWGARPPRAREALEPWTAGEVLPDWTPAITLDEGLKSL